MNPEDRHPINPIALIKRDGFATSPTIGAIGTALAKAQAKIGPAMKNKRSAHLKNRYSDLYAVIDSSTEPLTEEGLALTFLVQTDPANRTAGGIVLLIHGESGEWMGSLHMLPVEDQRGTNEKQRIGQCETYAARYAIQRILNQASAEPSDEHGRGPADEDGGAPNPARPRRPANPNRSRHGHTRPDPAPRDQAAATLPKHDFSFITTTERDTVRKIIAKRGITEAEVDAFAAAHERPPIGEMNHEQIANLRRFLEGEDGIERVIEHSGKVLADRA